MTDHSEQLKNLKQLLETADEDPAAVDIEHVEEFLTAEVGEHRNTALKILVVVAQEEPDRVVPIAGSIIDRLDDDYLVASGMATMAVGVLAKHQPDAVRPAVPDLVEKLDHETPLYRFRAAGAIAPLLEAYPEDFAQYGDEIIDVLVEGPRVSDTLEEMGQPSDASERDMYEQYTKLLQEDRMRDEGVREILVNVLVEIAKEEPEIPAQRISDLVRLLEDQSPPVRGGAIEVVRHVAENDLAAAESTIDTLLERLNDEQLFVRARAIRTLGFIEATEAIGPLREMAESPPAPGPGADEDDVQVITELAADTADWLESNA